MTLDGRCYNNRAELIGVINVADGTAGSFEYHYLGCVSTVFRTAARPDGLQDSFLVYDASELHGGTLVVIGGAGAAPGAGATSDSLVVDVKDGAGSIVATIDASGTMVAPGAMVGGQGGAGGGGGGEEEVPQLLGKADGYTHDDARTLALFLVLVDPGMLGMR